MAVSCCDPKEKSTPVISHPPSERQHHRYLSMDEDDGAEETPGPPLPVHVEHSEDLQEADPPGKYQRLVVKCPHCHQATNMFRHPVSPPPNPPKGAGSGSGSGTCAGRLSRGPRAVEWGGGGDGEEGSWGHCCVEIGNIKLLHRRQHHMLSSEQLHFPSWVLNIDLIKM